MVAPLVLFLIELAASYILNRLMQPNGPRNTNPSAGLGDYGVPKPRLFGEKVRVTGVVIAQALIKETKHRIKNPLDYLLGLIIFVLPKKYTYTYSDTLALLLADRTDDDPIEDLVKLFAGGKTIFNNAESAILSEAFDGDGRLISRKYGKNKYLKSVTVYGGGFDQTADPILTSVVGAQPGYRGSAYVVLEDLQITKEFGNSVPVPIEALVQVKTGETLASVCESVCSAAGIDPIRDLSTTALASQVVRGFAITAESNCWDAVKPLMPAFGVDCAEVAGQLRFYQRSQSLRATIPTDEMGAYVYGDSSPEKFTFSRSPDLKLPKKTSLTFVDPDRDYQPNTAKSERSEGDAQSNIDVSVPLVLTADEAASAAALMHWDAWLGRSQLGFSLTDTWRPTVGLAYAIPVADQFVPYRMTRAIRGANGITEVEAQSDERVTYTAEVAGTSGTPIEPGTTLFADTRIVAIDGAIIDDADDEYGFYIAEAGSNSGWTEGDIEASPDGVTYSLLESGSDSAIMGDVTGTLTAGTTDGLDDTLDTTTVLTVVLLHDAMELANATDAELDAFANLAFVGKDAVGEYLQFKTATNISGSTWELTDLRRGRKGSDWAIASHVSGEEFVLLTDGGVFRIPSSTDGNWGMPLDLRGVTFGQDEADADIISFTNTGEGKRPYSPVNVEGAWDGSNNLTITWDARSRLNAGGLGIDDQNNYEVEITNATPVRTITATGVETAAYSAADQVTDGLIAGQIVEGRVRQLSDVDDGRWRDFTLYGPLATLFDSDLVSFDGDTLTWDAG